MPLRVTLPAEGIPSVQAKRIGTPQLVTMRQRMLAPIYDAPETTLTPREREAARVLFAYRSGCPTCVGGRLGADKPGFSEQPIDEGLYQAAMQADISWTGYTERERLVVEFADRFERDIDNLNQDDGLWHRLGTHFSEVEICDLLNMFGVWIGTSRTNKALGVGSEACDLGRAGNVPYSAAIDFSSASQKTPAN